jgi:hypothetical protein
MRQCYSRYTAFPHMINHLSIGDDTVPLICSYASDFYTLVVYTHTGKGLISYQR